VASQGPGRAAVDVDHGERHRGFGKDAGERRLRFAELLAWNDGDGDVGLCHDLLRLDLAQGAISLPAGSAPLDSSIRDGHAKVARAAGEWNGLGEGSGAAPCRPDSDRQKGLIGILADGTVAPPQSRVNCHDHEVHVGNGEPSEPDPDTMPPGRTAIEALRLMQDGGYRHLPVIKHGKVMGVVSRGDFRGLEQARLDEDTGLWERI
jgi:CBS domain-containing protein